MLKLYKLKLNVQKCCFIIAYLVMSTNSADEAYLKIRQEAVNEKCGFLKGTE